MDDLIFWIIYFSIGLVLAIIFRITNEEKMSIGWYLGIIVVWPIALLIAFLEIEL